MKRTLVVLLCFMFASVSAASADWRWSAPNFKERKITYSCSTLTCLHDTYVKEKKQLQKKVDLYNKRRLAEWTRYTAMFIPDCTWFGESGYGPKYAPGRYTVLNFEGSGARGKFQLMPSTYTNNAKYFDWSPLDQEIAARREFRKHGTSPWSNCH